MLRRVLALVDRTVGTLARRVPTDRKVAAACRVGRLLGRALDDRRTEITAGMLARWHMWSATRTSVQVKENLEIILGHDHPDDEVRRLTEEALQTYSRYWIEYARLLAASPDSTASRVRLSGLANLSSAQADGRGAIVVSFHMGQFEVASAALAVAVGDVLGIARTLESDAIAQILSTARRSAGNDNIMVVDPGRDRASDAARLFRSLRSGGVVAVMIDRFVVGATSSVPFCDGEIKLARGPALLALRTGAAVLPSFTWTENGAIRGHVGSEVPHPDGATTDARCDVLLALIARAFEEVVRERPAEWHLTIPLFASAARS